MPPTVPPKSVRPLALTMRLKGVSAESESTVEENVTGPAVAASPELIVTSTPSCTGPRYTCPAAPVVVTLPPRLVGPTLPPRLVGPLAIARLPRGVVPPTGAANVVPVSDDTVRLPGVVALRSTLTELEVELTMARSGLPSPLKSPIETEMGLLPVANVAWMAYDGVVAPGAVVLKSTLTELDWLLAMARSGLPSPLKSPIETE